MKKEKLLFVFAILMIVSIFTGAKVKAAQKDDFMIVDGVLLSYNGTDTTVIVPDGVTRIGEQAFYGTFGHKVVNVTLPDSVVVIEDAAFEWCNELTTINIPKNCTKIGDGAFYDCQKLTSITLPSRMKKIGSLAFFQCFELKSINLENVTDIGDSAFDECMSLENVTLSKQLEVINHGVFTCCYGFTNITIPYGVTRIESEAFYQCKNLESISIPDSVTYLGDLVFGNCEILSQIDLSDNITDLGINPFYEIPWLTDRTDDLLIINNILVDYKGFNQSLAIPYGVTKIGGWSITGTNLISITIPDTVTSIGFGALVNNQYLKDITIPDSVTEMGNDILLDSAWHDDKTDDFVILNGFLLKYQGDDSKVVIPDEVKYICPNAFYDNLNVSEVVMSDGVRAIGNSAFIGCECLKNITFSKNLKKVDSNAFKDCKSLTSVTLPDSVSYIGDNIFEGDFNLRYIKYPQKVDYIGKLSLRYYFFDTESYNLQEVILPEGLTEIEEDCYKYFIRLEKITIPNSVKQIGYNAFAGCKMLKKVELPEGLAIIDDYAYEYCSRLCDVTVPKSVTSIGDYSFYDSLDKSNITFLNSKTTFGEYIFGKANVTIQGYYNSTAKNIAKQNKNTFIAIDPIKINTPKLTLNLGGEYRLSVKDSTDIAVWDSTDRSIIKVDNSGMVAAKKEGTAVITATIGDYTCFCEVTVVQCWINSSSLKLKVGKDFKLSIVNAPDTVIIWKSSNSKVVTVDKNGRITAKKVGTSVITAIVNGKTYQCKVVVVALSF